MTQTPAPVRQSAAPTEAAARPESRRAKGRSEGKMRKLSRISVPPVAPVDCE